MSVARRLRDYEKLSVPEKIMLIEDLWDELAEEAATTPLTKAQRDEMDRRVEAYRGRKSRLSTWDDVRRRVRKRK